MSSQVSCRMKQILNAHLLPELADPHDLAGHTSVVIDVLRASTTITNALANGAEKIIPCLTVEEARQMAHSRPGALLGGERGGKRLSRFDFGNSPAEYSRDQVAGKTIVFTTTNGTKAIMRCMGSARVLIGAVLNRAAVCDLVADDRRVDLVCAGTDGEFSMDDALAAGGMADLLSRRTSWELNDAAKTCLALWRHAVGSSAEVDAIRMALTQSIGGRNLIQLGMQTDLTLAAACDDIALVPELDRSAWEIRIA